MFTKIDIFIEKLKTTPLSGTFPDYKGDDSYPSAFEFIRTKFLGRVRSGREPHIFTVNAANPESVCQVMKSVAHLRPRDDAIQSTAVDVAATATVTNAPPTTATAK